MRPFDFFIGSAFIQELHCRWGPARGPRARRGGSSSSLARWDRPAAAPSVRSSHNMPTPEWVEACERSGMMLMCETRLMSSNPEGLAQLETLIKRYRNSPAVILWSMGNEEFSLQGTPVGEHIVAAMVRRPTKSIPAASAPPPSTARMGPESRVHWMSRASTTTSQSSTTTTAPTPDSPSSAQRRGFFSTAAHPRRSPLRSSQCARRHPRVGWFF